LYFEIDPPGATYLGGGAIIFRDTGTDLPAADYMKVLGVVLDRRLSFDRHAASVAKACNFHAHAIRHIRHLLTTELVLTPACSLTLFRLDYCNAVLHGAMDTGWVDPRVKISEMHYLSVRVK